MESEALAWPVGRGYLLFDWLYLGLAWVAFAYSLAIDLRKLDKRRSQTFARRLLIAGVFFLAANGAVRMYLLGDLPISLPALLGQSLLFAGVILLSRSKLGIRGAGVWPRDPLPNDRSTNR